MVYRHKKSKKSKITFVGLGKDGMEAMKKPSAFFDCLPCGQRVNEQYNITHIENEITSIVHIEVGDEESNENELVPWDDTEIEAERKTERMFIIFSNPSDPCFKMYSSATVDLLSTSYSMRLAFFIDRDGETDGYSDIFKQQMNHIFNCKSVMEAFQCAVYTIFCTYTPSFLVDSLEGRSFRNILGSTNGNMYLTHKMIRSRPFDLKNDLITNSANTILREIDQSKEYEAFMLVLCSDFPVSDFSEMVENFRNTFGKTIRIRDDMAALTDKFSSFLECFIVLFEVND